jgi:hypothetical protein
MTMYLDNERQKTTGENDAIMKQASPRIQDSVRLILRGLPIPQLQWKQILRKSLIANRSHKT